MGVLVGFGISLRIGNASRYPSEESIGFVFPTAAMGNFHGENRNKTCGKLRMNHDSYSDDFIRGVLCGVKTVALVGASANPARASNMVLKYLQSKGYRVFPVNPQHAGEEIFGLTVYSSLADVPEPIDLVDIFRRLDAIPAVVDEALALESKPKAIWMQLGLRDDAQAARAEAAGIKVVMNRCTKIEYGRLCGEASWFGVNSRRLSSKKPKLAEGHQHLDLDPKT
jgi:uncharacterized protein